MKMAKRLFTVSLIAGFISVAAFADAEIGKTAPQFKLLDTSGKSHELSSFKGKTVVLEWLNFDCPFVKKHYGSGNMQKLQEEQTKKGIVWLSIVSSAKGKEGYYEPQAMKSRQEKEGGKQTAILFDTDGKVGKAYGAKTTPHFFIVNKEGLLAYKGAIDDKPSTDQEDVATAKSYVRAALDELAAGRKVTTSDTKSYGCGVKY